MSHWSQGYNVDVTYTHGFYKETAPSWLNFIATFDGVSSPKGNWRYLELGCGNGFGLILLAALHPGHDFVGIDFDPRHVAHGQALAKEVGLSNIQFIEADFTEIAHDWPEDWGRFDYVVAHGIISWLDPSVRQAVVDTINVAAKPGALVYLSYNCLPGQVSTLPIQHLFRLWQTTEALTPSNAITTGMARFEGLMTANSRMTKALPLIEPRIDDMKTSQRNYLVHEFLHDNWHPLWFDDVAREMRGAKLDFVGSAEIGDRFAAIVLPPESFESLNGFDNPVVREVMLDVLMNRRFRSDVFARGSTRLLPERHATLLGETTLCLSDQYKKDGVSFEILHQTVSGKPDVFRPLIEPLEDGPKSISELARVHVHTPSAMIEMKKTAMYLVQSGNAELHIPVADKTAIKQLNRVICNLVAQGAPYGHIIASENGTVLAPHYTDMIMLSEILETPERLAPDKLAQKMVARLERTGQLLYRKGTKDVPQEGMLPYAISLATDFLADRYPRWKALGVF